MQVVWPRGKAGCPRACRVAKWWKTFLCSGKKSREWERKARKGDERGREGGREGGKEVSLLQLRGLDACLPACLPLWHGTTQPPLMIAIVIGGRREGRRENGRHSLQGPWFVSGTEEGKAVFRRVKQSPIAFFSKDCNGTV